MQLQLVSDLSFFGINQAFNGSYFVFGFHVTSLKAATGKECTLVETKYFLSNGQGYYWAFYNLVTWWSLCVNLARLQPFCR